MKIWIAALGMVGTLLALPSGVHALPFADPDILVEADAYTAAGGPVRWYTLPDGSMMTAWNNQWIEYTVDLTVGTWDIGLNVVNYGLLYPDWNYEYTITAEMTGFDPVQFSVLGSSTEVNNGFFTVDVAAAGTYTVRYTWTNDRRYVAPDGTVYDANIQIASAFFDDPPASSVPEPGTLLLMGTGLLGLGLLRRRGNLS